MINRSAASQENTTAEKGTVPLDNKVGGYADVKKDYELEIENLERLKERLDGL